MGCFIRFVNFLRLWAYLNPFTDRIHFYAVDSVFILFNKILEMRYVKYFSVSLSVGRYVSVVLLNNLRLFAT